MTLLSCDCTVIVSAVLGKLVTLSILCQLILIQHFIARGKVAKKSTGVKRTKKAVGSKKIAKKSTGAKRTKKTTRAAPIAAATNAGAASPQKAATPKRSAKKSAKKPKRSTKKAATKRSAKK